MNLELQQLETSLMSKSVKNNLETLKILRYVYKNYKFRNNKILVIEDTLATRSILKTAIEVEGYTVLEADDGMNALEIMRNNAFSLLIIDMNMPRMGGKALCKVLKEDINFKHIPIIIISADDCSAQIKDINFYKLFLKPIDIKNILINIEDLFNKNKGIK